ncbi:hypothetical protein D049_0927B, partial [Vibrio parahaemolyticus VPTS-2010]
CTAGKPVRASATEPNSPTTVISLSKFNNCAKPERTMT